MKFKSSYLYVYAIILAGVIVAGEFGKALSEGRRPPVQYVKIPIQTFERRPEPTPIPGAPLAAPSPQDPILVVAPGGPKRDSIGTAFAIPKTGWFVTARHVVDECYRLGIIDDYKRVIRVSEVVPGTSADIALLKVISFPPPLYVEQPQLRYGQSGFGFGFPHGKWGQYHASLLGRARIRRPDGRGPLQKTLNWSVANMPASGFGGMSGGPMLDATGTVIGVHNSGSPRRGRINTVAPVSLIAMLSDNGLNADDRPRSDHELEELNEESYVVFGERLRARGRIAMVLCDVRDRGRIMGWR